MHRISELQVAIGEAVSEVLKAQLADTEAAIVLRRAVGAEGMNAPGIALQFHTTIDVGVIVDFVVYAGPRAEVEEFKNDCLDEHGSGADED